MSLRLELGDEVNYSDFDFWIIASGKGIFNTPHGEYNLQTGDCLFLRHWEHYRCHTLPSELLDIYYIHFDCYDKNGRKIKPTDKNLPAFQFNVSNLSFSLEIFNRIIACYQNNSEDSEINAWLVCLLYELLGKNNETEFRGPELQQKQMIDTICEEMRSEPGGNWSIDILAKRAHCSGDHFIRMFKKFTGITPRAYLVQIKAETAKSLLLTSSYSINRISSILGYYDIFHFSKEFSRRVGMSPTGFRKRK
ncbi:MAG: AraC family transcriptional regulator [Planctomycetota bacterium]